MSQTIQRKGFKREGSFFLKLLCKEKKRSIAEIISKRFMKSRTSILSHHNSLLSLKRERLEVNEIQKEIEISEEERDRLMDKAIEIFQKPPEKRTVSKISQAVEYTKNVKFFKSLIEEREEGFEIHERCCKNIEYLKKEAGEVLFLLGDKGEEFYIILRGSVRIYFPTRPRESVIELPTPPTNESLSLDFKIIGAGSSFGELALLRDSKRSATVTCNENCEFALLRKTNFLQILGDIEKEKIDNELKELKKSELFKDISNQNIRHIFYSADHKTVKRGQNIYSEGDSVKSLFVIRKGRFVIKKNQPVPSSNKNIHQFSSDYLIKMRKNISQDVAILETYDIFGHDEIIKNESVRNFSVVCDSAEANLLIIPKEIAVRFMLNSKGEITFKNNIETFKDHFRNSRIEIFNTVSALTYKKLVKSPKKIDSRCKLTGFNILESEVMKKLENESLDYLQIEERKSYFRKDDNNETIKKVDRKMSDKLKSKIDKSKISNISRSDQRYQIPHEFSNAITKIFHEKLEKTNPTMICTSLNDFYSKEITSLSQNPDRKYNRNTNNTEIYEPKKRTLTERYKSQIKTRFTESDETENLMNSNNTNEISMFIFEKNVNQDDKLNKIGNILPLKYYATGIRSSKGSSNRLNQRRKIGENSYSKEEQSSRSFRINLKHH